MRWIWRITHTNVYQKQPDKFLHPRAWITDIGVTNPFAKVRVKTKITIVEISEDFPTISLCIYGYNENVEKKAELRRVLWVVS